ncbi:MAG TPA: diguanylate cyclase [Cellvibrio sp.]|nr:diguanylate cyclase [Cellvibrio sp.]
MVRFTPAVRLSLGLVIMTISILILAQAIGLTPGAERQQLDVRKRLAETLASQVGASIVRGDEILLQYLLESSVERNPEIKSVGVRRNDNIILAQTKFHPKFWAGAKKDVSTPTHIRFPIMINGGKRADFEISFEPLLSDKHPVFGIPTFGLLIIFVGLTGFVGFWFYIKRVLKHLDPSAVVPARVRNALNILAEGVLILDKREQIVLANTSLMEQLQRSEQSLVGKKASKLGWSLDPKQQEQSYPWITAISTGVKQTGVRVLLPSGKENDKIFLVNAVPILDGKGVSQGTIAVFEDITELETKSRLLEQMIEQLAATQVAIENKNVELTYLATRDPLTNCFNRRALYEHLDGKFDGARSSDAEFSCIMADIDFFKKVNDTYGHAAGDEVIKMAANSLREVVRDMDMVARFGGEEFCVILPGAPLEQAQMIAERCREKIAEQDTNGVKVTGSFGVTSIRMGASTAGQLIQQADEALYYSKQHGRNQVTCWTPGMESLIADTQH